MASAVLRDAKPGRFLAVGLITAIGLLAGSDSAPGQAKKPPAGLSPAQQAFAAATSDSVKAINELLDAQWKANKLIPSQQCTDYEFIRRATLDIIGRIAKPEEIATFLKDPANLRRPLLIERLLTQKDMDGHIEYAKFWSQMWTNWLMTRSATTAYSEQMREWLEKHLAEGGSHRDMTIKLLTASGKNNENGATNYILQHVGEPVPANKRGEEGMFDYVPVTSRTTRLFLGFQTQCTQCHDHPFNPEWQQKHFWGVNAFFRQTEREGIPLPANKVAKLGAPVLGLVDNPRWNADSVVFYERRNGVVLPTKARFLDGQAPSAGAQNTRREMLAQFLVNHEYFSKAYVNRLWGHFFSRGLNEQSVVDDFGEHNPVVHEELLNRLSADFAGTGSFDPKNLIRWICNSRAYNLSASANQSNAGQDAEVFFSRMLLKAMGPEQLFESLATATQGNSSADARDRWMRSLTLNFGDDEGNEVSFNGTVVQALMLINGNDINQAILDNNGTVGKALKRGTPVAIMNDLYMAALNRPATQKEQTRIMQQFKMRVPDRNASAPYQDLFWALLNSSEFILNH